jgi:16S rRNA (adenine1518-N6/adenine1519-N6)-dimethyltransferase
VLLEHAGEHSRGNWVIAGNLPYQITGPLLQKAVFVAPLIERAVFLVQKEVCDRLVASPGTKEYGALSVFCQAQFITRRALTIGPGAFVPRPRVDSAVVVLESRTDPVCEETATFRAVVKHAFSARRKTLRNAWRGLLPAQELGMMAQRCDIDLSARGETLSVHDFARAARVLEEMNQESR